MALTFDEKRKRLSLGDVTASLPSPQINTTLTFYFMKAFMLTLTFFLAVLATSLDGAAPVIEDIVHIDSPIQLFTQNTSGGRSRMWLMHLELLTNRRWAQWCPQCSQMENTLVKVHGLLPAFLNVSGPIEDISMGLRGDSDRDQRLFVHARVVDCSHFASSDSPCGQTQAVPQLKLSLREGESKREFIFKGVGDAQGVLHWLRTVLPPRYGRRDVPSIPLTRKRSLLRPMMFSLPFWSGKDVLDRIRAAPPD